MKLLADEQDWQQAGKLAKQSLQIERSYSALLDYLFPPQQIELAEAMLGLAIRREGNEVQATAFGITVRSKLEITLSDNRLVGRMVFAVAVPSTATTNAYDSACMAVQFQGEHRFRFEEAANSDWIFVGDSRSDDVDRETFRLEFSGQLLYALQKFAIG